VTGAAVYSTGARPRRSKLRVALWCACVIQVAAAVMLGVLTARASAAIDEYRRGEREWTRAVREGRFIGDEKNPDASFLASMGVPTVDPTMARNVMLIVGSVLAAGGIGCGVAASLPRSGAKAAR
jgi:hypothetical protein